MSKAVVKFRLKGYSVSLSLSYDNTTELIAKLERLTAELKRIGAKPILSVSQHSDRVSYWMRRKWLDMVEKRIYGKGPL